MRGKKPIMAKSMRIRHEELREMPLNMQEQVAMAFVKDGQPEKRDRIDAALSELVAALMEKYTKAVTATVTITEGIVRISVCLTESRVIQIAEM